MHRAIVFVLGAIAGAVTIALLATYPKGEVTQASYCTVCGAVRYRVHARQVLTYAGGSGVKVGAFAEMVERRGQHDHHWSTEAFASSTFPSESQDLEHRLVTDMLDRIERLNHDPDAIALVHEAFEADKARTLAFVQRLLDAQRPLPESATRALLGRNVPWEEKWAAVDALGSAYHCGLDPEHVRCELKVKGRDELAYESQGPSLRRDGTALDGWLAERARSGH